MSISRSIDLTWCLCVWKFPICFAKAFIWATDVFSFFIKLAFFNGWPNGTSKLDEHMIGLRTPTLVLKLFSRRSYLASFKSLVVLLLNNSQHNDFLSLYPQVEWLCGWIHTYLWLVKINFVWSEYMYSFIDTFPKYWYTFVFIWWRK